MVEVANDPQILNLLQSEIIDRILPPVSNG